MKYHNMVNVSKLGVYGRKGTCMDILNTECFKTWYSNGTATLIFSIFSRNVRQILCFAEFEHLQSRSVNMTLHQRLLFSIVR